MEQKKIKPFPPSLREKSRYLLIKGDPLKFKNILIDFLGIYNFSKLNFDILKEFSFEDYHLIKINSSELIKVRSSLCVIENDIEIIKVFGTIKKFKEFSKKQF